MLENTPKDSALWEKQARVLARMEDWTRCGQAVDSWEKTVGQHLPAMDALRGEVALGNGRKAEAVGLWNACLRAAPSDHRTSDKLAALLGEINQWAGAVKVLEQRVKLKGGG